MPTDGAGRPAALLPRARRIQIGVKCKALIDHARLLSLRASGFEVKTMCLHLSCFMPQVLSALRRS